MYFAECTVTVRFTEEEVIEWLVDNGVIEDEAPTYTPTFEQLQDYAWELIESDNGEYGSVSIS